MHKLKLMGLRLLVMTGVVGAGALLLPSGAVAEDLASPCPYYRALCLFEGESFSGAVFNVSALDHDKGTCVNLPQHGWEGRAHSAYNTNSSNAAIFLNENCIGYPYPVPANGGLTTLPFTPKSVYVF
jgi:hypothetical protein